MGQVVILQDYSAAFFATGNVAISKHMLNAASRLLSNGDHGPFDTNFSDYGWEDLELGGEYRRDLCRVCSADAARHSMLYE